MQKSLILLSLLIGFGLISKAQETDQQLQEDSLERRRVERYKKFKIKRDSIRKAKIEKQLSSNDPGSIDYLDLSGGGLSTVPSRAKAFKNLKRLNLSENNIGKLPAWLFKLDSLEYLNISFNRPRRRFRFRRNSSIKQVLLNNSNHKGFPRGLSKLKGMQAFSFNYNPAIPSKLNGSQLKHIKKLSMMGDTLSSGYGFLEKADHLTALNLARSNIQSFPREILILKNLKELVLAENKISELPLQLVELRNLERLILYKNELTSYPAKLYGFPSLVELDIYYNRIKYLPDGIQRIKKLRKIYLSFNQLYEIPSGLMECKDLEYLYAHHNHLTEVPKGISNLDSLKVLDLNHNNLQFFSNEICELEKLEELDLSFNALEELDPCLVSMPSLQRVFLQENSYNPDSEGFQHVIQVLEELKGTGRFVQPQLEFSIEE